MTRGEAPLRRRGGSRIAFWLAVSAFGDVLVVDGAVHRYPAGFAIGVAVSLAAIWMLGGDRWRAWERTTHDAYDRVDVWPLIEAWDPDDWLSDPPWEDAEYRAARLATGPMSWTATMMPDTELLAEAA